MKDWMHFALQFLARAGLLVAVCAWVFSQSPSGRVRRIDLHLGPTTLTAGTSSSVVAFFVHPPDYTTYFQIPEPGDDTMEPQVRILGLRVWIEGIQFIFVAIEHWLLCLTFLIATIATSILWRKPAPESAEPEQTEDG